MSAEMRKVAVAQARDRGIGGQKEVVPLSAAARLRSAALSGSTRSSMGAARSAVQRWWQFPTPLHALQRSLLKIVRCGERGESRLEVAHNARD
jgi:hypothetical protein